MAECHDFIHIQMKTAVIQLSDSIYWWDAREA